MDQRRTKHGNPHGVYREVEKYEAEEARDLIKALARHPRSIEFKRYRVWVPLEIALRGIIDLHTSREKVWDLEILLRLDAAKDAISGKPQPKPALAWRVRKEKGRRRATTPDDAP